MTNGGGTFVRPSSPIDIAANAQAIINNPAGFYFNVHSAANHGRCHPRPAGQERLDARVSRPSDDRARGRPVAPGGSSLAGQQPGAASASAIKNPVAPTAKSIDSGRQLFQQYCKACHGADATGNGPLAPKDVVPPNLIDAEWAHGPTDGEIFTNIRNGIGPKFDMKSLKSKMTATEIWNLVNYLRSLGEPAVS